VVVIEGRIQGEGIHFDRPLPFPQGQRVIVRIEPVSGREGRPNGDAAASEGPTRFADLPFFGQWSDRQDVPESETMVRQERQKWQQRAGRPD
jgi:hypothetical protein